ncbi:MAG: hypothetical protein M3O31_05190 [Acidobacteriota bacterium]|nr:hypothetical protein [Acidobacteriota bacterium]
MESPTQFASTYQHMSDGELVQIANEGGLLPEAKQALAEELRRRKLKVADLLHLKEPHRTSLEKETTERWFPMTWGHTLGFGLYGGKYLNERDREDNIQVQTKFFVFGIPLVPVASYRFKCSGSADKWLQWNPSQKPLNRVRLDWSQVFMTWFQTALWIVGTIAAVVLYERFKER